MNESEPEQEPRQITLSRRAFFAAGIVGGTALAVSLVSVPAIREPLFEKLDEKKLTDRVIAEATANRRSAVWTIIETIGVWAANIGLGALVDRLGLHHGGRAADGEYYAEQAESREVALYFQQLWVLPIIEEICFRLLPSALYSEEQPPDLKIHWGTGLTSATIFAAVHNFSKPDEKTIAFHLDSIPLEQFVLGVYCWYAQRVGGFGHAAGSHVLYNHLCEAYWQLYERHQFEKEYEQGAAEAGEEEE